MSQTIIESDAAALARRVADWLVERIAHAQAPVRIALSGGSTPRPIYQLLGELPRSNRVPWDRVYLYWSDERLVPYDSSASNYGMVRNALIEHVPIPPDNVHPMPVRLGAEEAADRYERMLRASYGYDRLDPAVPLFDTVLLGIGIDGHTASLFPGNAALDDVDHWVVSSSGNRPEPRISLALPALGSARAVAFIATGAAKRAVVGRARGGDITLPAGRVRSNGELFWFLDRAAAI
jgi:6-phosphogluconolactonase